MKRILLVIMLLVLITGIVPQPAHAQYGTGDQEPYNGEVLCTPGVYLTDPVDCLPLGPSQFLTEMAHKGITFPLRSLPATPPPLSLTELDLKFAKINIEDYEPLNIFSSLEGAVDGSTPGRFIQAGVNRWVSYKGRSEVNGISYLQLACGEWVRGSPAEYSTFMGLVFKDTPRQNFGWIIQETEPRVSPASNAPVSGRKLVRENVVTVYDTLEVNDMEWSMIGMNEWVDRQSIRRVIINTTPPEGVTNNRWIEINLYEQTLSVYDQGKLVFATLITTGAEPYYTQPGLFQVYSKLPYETMTGAFTSDKSDYYYLQDVPWTMYFDKARALHGAYWRTLFGYPASHGCVNLSIGDAHWLFDWAKEGDWVYVWDISGDTPTDPEAYTEGGA